MTATVALPKPPPEQPKGVWRLSRASLLIALLALAGLGIWMYPNAASWFTQLRQSEVTANAVTTTKANTETNAQQLALANEYNDALRSGASLDAYERLPTARGASDTVLKYEDILQDGSTGVMTRLRVPGINLDLPVYHGTSDDTLQKGLGHLEGTSLPVGGGGTHSVITGHRGLASAVMLTNLNKTEVGDTFTLTTFGEVLSYRVVSTKVVEPEQTELLQAIPGSDLVTLVTCTPLGINSQRILVTGQRTTPTPAADVAEALTPPNIPGFPWWAVVMGSGVVVATVYIWASGYPPKRRIRTQSRAAMN